MVPGAGSGLEHLGSHHQRAFENVGSSKVTDVVKLVDQIPNMPVGQDVCDGVLRYTVCCMYMVVANV